MHRFVQLHLLTSYPPANLNRDDLGRPKTAVMGGAPRLRISSQSLKRAWRKSELFEHALAGHIGTRTKELGREVAKALAERGIAEKAAREWARQIAGVFGKLKVDKKDDGTDEALEIGQLAHLSPVEWQAVMDLAATLAGRGSGPTDAELDLLRKETHAADIALFGRMLADVPKFNVEAAAQVAHAISVHRVEVEDDFFTAVDDLNTHEEDAGAGHMGETEFAAGLFYLYACIDTGLLRENLGDDALAARALRALIECAATVSPTGKQNSFASRARASYLLCEAGDQQPRSLSVAFLKPVAGGDLLGDAVGRLKETSERMDAVYGPCATQRYEFNALAGTGSLQAVLDGACG